MKSPNRRPERLTVTSPAQPATTPLRRLREWQRMAEGAYSANTLRAQKEDGTIFQVFCEGRGESFLPADLKTIRAFIEHEVTEGKKPATVRRYIATIGRPHVGAGLLNPYFGEAVRLALKKMSRETSARRLKRVLWAGTRSRNLSEVRAKAFERIVSAPYFVSPMKRLRVAGNSWRSSYETLSSGRMALGRP